MASRLRSAQPAAPLTSTKRTRSPTRRGRHFEQLAEAFLHERGLVTLARNHRCRGGELDLVMHDGISVVFVEVRYRRTDRFGGARASIDRRKQARLVHAAENFLAVYPDYVNSPCRFDVIAMGGDANAPSCDWIAGAFSA